MRHYAKLLRATLTALLLLVMAGAAVAGPLQDGTAAYDRGDYATALRLLRPLADQGDADAQFSLGLMYFNAYGLPEDYVQAHKWFNLAASRYSASEKGARDKAIKGLNFVASKMTSEQIAEAQKLAHDWKATPER